MIWVRTVRLENREEATWFAALGTAVLCAAITTGGSAAFLLFCKVQLLVNFGVGILWNTIWSCVFALGFFPAALVAVRLVSLRRLSRGESA